MDKLLKELRSPKKSSREPFMVLLRMMNWKSTGTQTFVDQDYIWNKEGF